MSKIIDLLMGLIAYVCIATVITLSLIVGYWRYTDKLTNEKMFRLVAVMQDIDLQQVAKADEKNPTTVPPAEPSLNELQHFQQVQDRNSEVKQLQLQRGKQEFDASYQKLIEQTARFDQMAQSWQKRLNQEQEQTSQQNIAKVVSQLEQVNPEVGKDQIRRWISEKKMDDAILLMSKMSESKLAKILKTFKSDEELKQLHEIHEQIIGSSTDNTRLERALKELNDVGGK